MPLLRRNKLSPEQVSLFRAGHAHAGVLLVMSLVYYWYLESTALLMTVQLVASLALIAGVLLQAGGFFWQAFKDPKQSWTGARITNTGAVLLAASVLILAFGLCVQAQSASDVRHCWRSARLQVPIANSCATHLGSSR